MRNLRCLEADPGGVFAGSAVRWRLFDAGTPHEVPGWDQLASGRSFYVAADWLRFTDTDRVARSQYLGLCIDGRLAMSMPAISRRVPSSFHPERHPSAMACLRSADAAVSCPAFWSRPAPAA